jgi:mannose-6-phosphate isomerase-like protein (cupin superfamily)
MKTRYADIPAYRTKDGSEIRELMHPDHQGNRLQSLAEATIPAGAATLRHLHRVSEELYHVTHGHGEMQLGDHGLTLAPGDTVLIPPGTPHAVINTGKEPLRILCCCSPAYSHADTVLLDTALVG